MFSFFYDFAGEPATFKLAVRPAKNYPVDLYYLMDMSKSMEDDLGNLRKLAGKIGIIASLYTLLYTCVQRPLYL